MAVSSSVLSTLSILLLSASPSGRVAHWRRLRIRLAVVAPPLALLRSCSLPSLCSLTGCLVVCLCGASLKPARLAASLPPQCNCLSGLCLKPPAGPISWLVAVGAPASLPVFLLFWRPWCLSPITSCLVPSLSVWLIACVYCLACAVQRLGERRSNLELLSECLSVRSIPLCRHPDSCCCRFLSVSCARHKFGIHGAPYLLAFSS